MDSISCIDKRNGGFSVRVVVGPQRPTDFAITVAAEGASQRSQPKAPPFP